MTETSLDELGPVDYLVVEFPAEASNFTGEMATELLALVDSGTIRVIDVLILNKNEDGTVEAMELSDINELGELQASRPSSRTCWPRTTSSTSPLRWSRAAPPACSSGRICGPRPSQSAARRSGGQLIANGRIPIQAIIASIEADEALATEGV